MTLPAVKTYLTEERLREHLSVGSGYHAFKTLTAEEVDSAVTELLALRQSSSPDGQTAGAVEAFKALDVADRLIERAYGMDVPGEWHRAYRKVANARAPAKAPGEEH